MSTDPVIGIESFFGIYKHLSDLEPQLNLGLKPSLCAYLGFPGLPTPQDAREESANPEVERTIP